jgi:hypothetical protein
MILRVLYPKAKKKQAGKGLLFLFTTSAAKEPRTGESRNCFRETSNELP